MMTIRNALLAACLLSFFSNALAETRYVSDQLTIPLRTGDTMQHRIIKFLKSGTRLDVQESNEAGTYYRVVVSGSGKEGWVEANKLMNQPSARSQLAAVNKRLAALKADLKAKNKTIAELKTTIAQLEEQNEKLDKLGKRKSQQLAELEKVAARPVQLAQANMKLETELAKANRELDRALKENARLSDDNIKEWFMIGGAVSLISLFFGLIIPNFKWRRKKDSWGSF